jgi:hypothetical protein
VARYGEDEPLFYSKGDSFGAKRAQEEAVRDSIAKMSESQILNSSIEDLVNFVYDKFIINVPVLELDNAQVSQQEAQVLVQGWRNERPVSVPGTMVTLEVPYHGDEILFHIRASTWGMNPPRAIVTKSHVIVRQSGTDLSGDQVQAEFDRTIANIEQNLERLRSDFNEFNDRLKGTAREQIEARRGKLLANQNLVSGLKFKLKERPGAPQTYTAPLHRKKIEPRLPPVKAHASFKPEPVLAEEDYQHILKIIHDMTLVMERSPSSFATMQEEDIRQHFLVQLNGQYEGKATGETFNAEGKTDILVRDEGRNIFIAECKFWRGDKGYVETIDQLLGYLSWRDTKAAIIIFNRNKDMSAVLEKVKTLTEGHTLCKAGPKIEGETRFRYVFGQPNDANRETVITVMVFDIPNTTAIELASD